MADVGKDIAALQSSAELAPRQRASFQLLSQRPHDGFFVPITELQDSRCIKSHRGVSIPFAVCKCCVDSFNEMRRICSHRGHYRIPLMGHV